MAEPDHIFHASGDACPICAALDGTLVSAGYTAHDNCTCQTIPADDGDSGCEHHFEHGTTTRRGSGPFDASYGVEITVVCADGSEISASVEIDLSGSSEANDFGIDIVEDAMQEAADEMCGQCAEPKPYLCC